MYKNNLSTSHFIVEELDYEHLLISRFIKNQLIIRKDDNIMLSVFKKSEKLGFCKIL